MKRDRRRRPCEIIRQDLERHITLFTFMAAAWNQQKFGLYIDYSLTGSIDQGFVLDYKGVRKGIPVDFYSPTLTPSEDINQYLARRLREDAERRMLEADEWGDRT